MTSLHVRHRPQELAQVLGHESTAKSLAKVLEKGRAQTFLFTGPSGVGKTTLGRIVVHMLCKGKDTEANRIEVNAADKSGADDMRNIVGRTLTRAIGASPVKAVILDECHRLSSAAWTVLLKDTEEPPPHAYWILCTTDPGKVPKTILTRCLRYDLKPLSEEDLLELLVRVSDAEKLELGDDILEAIAEEAGGSPRQALVFLEACSYCETPAEARAAMRSAAKSKEVIDLIRFLMGGRGRTWQDAMRLLKGLEGMEAEGIRIVIVNYLAAVALGTKGNDKVRGILNLLSCFDRAYNPSDKMGPLLLSIGEALGLD